MSQFSIRIPPDSTGKKIIQSAILGIDYRDLTGDIAIGDVVAGTISGLLGTVASIRTSTISTGEIYVLLYEEVPTSITEGETITMVGSEPIGEAIVVGTGSPYYVGRNIAVGGNNPFNEQFIDPYGASVVRFYEGSHKFNSLGMGVSAGINTIGAYDFTYDSAEDLYSFVSGGGSVTTEYKKQLALFELTVDSSMGTYGYGFTNKYHYYWLGNGLTAYHSGMLSDNGVPGNNRRWG